MTPFDPLLPVEPARAQRQVFKVEQSLAVPACGQQVRLNGLSNFPTPDIRERQLPKPALVSTRLYTATRPLGGLTASHGGGAVIRHSQGHTAGRAILSRGSPRKPGHIQLGLNHVPYNAPRLHHAQGA